jgi:hypothetical protein
MGKSSTILIGYRFSERFWITTITKRRYQQRPMMLQLKGNRVQSCFDSAD